MPGTYEPHETHDRASAIERVVVGYASLMHALTLGHVQEFLEIPVTMPQAKVLYLVGSGRTMRMSDLSAALGVSLSTVSGVVDRLADHGLVGRRDDPADRRQVVLSLTDSGSALLERFHELNGRQLRALLGALDDDALRAVERAFDELAAAAGRIGIAPPPVRPGDRRAVDTDRAASEPPQPADSQPDPLPDPPELPGPRPAHPRRP